MGRNRTVKPDILRLDLSDGDFIDIKRRLNAGEQNAIFERMSPTLNAGEKTPLNTRAVMTSRVVEYLLSWSFTENGAPLPYSITMPVEERVAILNSLYPEDFEEVRDAINAHVAKIEKEIAERKNGQSGAVVSEATSPSAA